MDNNILKKEIFYKENKLYEYLSEYHIILYKTGNMSISYKYNNVYEINFHKHFGGNKYIDSWLSDNIFMIIEYILENNYYNEKYNPIIEDDYELFEDMNEEMYDEYLQLEKYKKEYYIEYQFESYIHFIYTDCKPLFLMIEQYVESKKREEQSVILLFNIFFLFLSINGIYVFLKFIS